MGFLCEKITRAIQLDADEILLNINNFFQGMLIRTLGIEQIKQQILQRISSNQVFDIEGWKNFINQEIYNSAFGQTTRAVVNFAMQDAKANYNDQTLPLLSLLFLANSDQATFVNAFKAVNLAQRAGQVGSNIQNVANNFQNNFQNNHMNPQGFFNFASGVQNAFNNIGGVYNQAVNPNMIRIDDLKKLICYHINFLTLLPVNLLVQYGEGTPMKSYFATVLNNAFNKNVQANFVNNKLFVGYEGRQEIDVNEFFNRNYNVLKNDNQLRKDLVTSYISTLSATDIVNIVTNKYNHV
jgi:hypothetical protein